MRLACLSAAVAAVLRAELMTPDEKVHQLEYEVQRLKDLIKRIQEPPEFRSVDAPVTALNAELDATIKGIRALTG